MTLSPRVLLLSAVGTTTHPYLGLLRDGLIAAGADVRLAHSLNAAALTAFHPDVIHLHWLERYDLPTSVRVARLRGKSDLPRRALRRVIEAAGNAAPCTRCADGRASGGYLGSCGYFKPAVVGSRTWSTTWIRMKGRARSNAGVRHR